MNSRPLRSWNEDVTVTSSFFAEKTLQSKLKAVKYSKNLDLSHCVPQINRTVEIALNLYDTVESCAMVDIFQIYA